MAARKQEVEITFLHSIKNLISNAIFMFLAWLTRDLDQHQIPVVSNWNQIRQSENWEKK